MVQRLRELGFEDSYALVGGMDAWTDAGYPVEKKAGTEVLQP